MRSNMYFYLLDKNVINGKMTFKQKQYHKPLKAIFNTVLPVSAYPAFTDSVLGDILSKSVAPAARSSFVMVRV
ncbi:hypothetical protein B0O44_101366 [Pedobacter nutrimenti]|uniref:Uncharacterized protein n=1 Tax=Pedobacter nutrimenti TaxID=1241337 RepID=A0A318UM66_9SPHI|nr:hypothetical protein B0O44_101366 [Pedobacter nutrimenti]